MRSDQSVEDICALTPLQQGMLFHTVCATTPGLYLVQACWTLHGELDLPVFIAAWQRTTDRHPAMRTAFEWRDLEKPVQVIYRKVELPVEHFDWRVLSDDDQEAQLGRFLEKDRERGFDLSAPPLHRLVLVQLREDRWHLVWSYYQAVLDGWSGALIQSEVGAVYEAAVRGEAPDVPDVEPYRNYLAWIEQQDTGRMERFWRKRLAGFCAPTRIQPRRDQGNISALAASQHELCFSFEESFTEDLNSRLRCARLTLSTLVQAAWALVLSKRSGSRDVLFGTVVSGRPPQLHGVESMIGFFINTLPTRVTVPVQASLVEWLRQLQENFLTARDFEHCALVDIQGWSDVPRGQALFESVVAFENYPVGDLDKGWGGDTNVIGFQGHENLNYPIALYAGLLSGRLTIKILYDAEQFDTAAAQWVLRELKTVIEQGADNLDQPVGSLDALHVSERQLLLADWNATQTEFPLEETFCDLFERQVERSLGKTAVVCGAECLTYAELNAWANGAARVLENAGVSHGEVIGILADRSIDFLVAILATFKAGGAYLPLDPRAPAARLATTWRQAHLSLVLHSNKYAPVCTAAAAAAGGTGCPNLTPLSDVTGAPPVEHNLPRVTGPRDLAYVIFTSGSTGMPKGAMVEQRGMVNHLFAKVTDLGVSETDRIAQNASQCFDISVWQFLAALLVGGETHIFSDEVVLDPWALLEAAEQGGVTILEMVPSVLRLVFDSGHVGDLPELRRLRWMVPTGEALPPEIVDSWCGRFPHVPVLNAYGPTECSDDVTHHAVLLPPAKETTSIPIGRPIANAATYILDDRMQLVPIGVPGELYVGGLCVGRGYVNDPLRTAACFLPDSFAHDAGARLYRTGDLARHLPDGTIDFLGRLDQQVKIRGFRIELGEIEATITKIGEIDQCVVVVHPAENGDDFLIAYFTSTGAPPTAHDLRDHLRTKLPDYMVPQAYVLLDAMPLTPNGKLDRTALLSSGGILHAPATDFAPPETAVEQRIAELWQEVLRLDHVSRQDNFFDLGGHSLLMLRVFENLRQSYPRLALVDLFHYPSVETLAEFVSSGDPKQSRQQNEEHRFDRREALRRQRQRRNSARANC